MKHIPLKKKYHSILVLIICFLCFSQHSYTQNLPIDSLALNLNKPFKSEDYQIIKFNKSDGYIIDELNSMEFDDDGWLWLTGIRYESVNYKLGARDPVILRFNGQAFYEVKIPEGILKETSNLVLQKSHTNSFYVKLESKQHSRLFKINAKSLQFKEIDRPGTAIELSAKYELLKLKEQFLYIQNHTNGNKLYYLDSTDSFHEIGIMKTEQNVIGSNTVDLGDRVLISKFAFGTEVITTTQNHLKETSSVVYKDSVIESFFYKNSDTYLNFYKTPTIFKYNFKTHDIEKTELFKNGNGSDQFVNQTFYQDAKENLLLQRIDGEYSNLNIYTDINSDPIWSYKFEHLTVQGTIFASRDLTKELIIENNNEIEVFIFNSAVVKTFLRNLSIRSMVQLKDNTVIIATDFNGWYLLDANMETIRPYWPIDNGNKITPLLNRDFFISNETIWSNDGKTILKLNLNTLNVQTFNAKNSISAMAQDEGQIIFVDEANNVNVFDKNTFQIKSIIKKDNVVYESIVISGNSFFAATSGGLKYFSSKEVELFKPNKDKQNNYIVALQEYGNDQLLLGTRSGEVLIFSTSNQTFQSIYKDELGASIATILVDDNDRIWLNTFAGIVVFNPETTETIRFGVNDGLSHFEANRFSSLKFKNGKFMVGTVNGVNYFHPDSLIASYNKNRYKHKLQFVSIESFNKDQKSVKTILDRNQLDSIQSITLPADNKNIVLDFGILKPRMNIAYYYRYRFDNSDWIGIDDKHEIRLLNLDSGNYNIEIQAIDKTKIEVLSTLSLGLVVEQFFYESIWFYSSLLLIITFIVIIYTFKWRQANKAHYKNKILRTEIEYKKKDLSDFATNISRNQQWNDYLITKMGEIKEAKGRKKGAALINLEKEIKDKNTITESNFEFQKRIDVLSNEFYNSLIKRYPNLSKTEVKLCSLIRLDLDNYDIATLQNVEVTSIYKSRYRLRKKLNITSDTDLNTFLKSF